MVGKKSEGKIIIKKRKRKRENYANYNLGCKMGGFRGSIIWLGK